MKMSEIEKKEVATRVRAMTDEEQLITVMNLPTGIILEEIERRTSKSSEILTGVLTILSNVTDDMTLEDMQTTISAIKNILRA